MQTTHEKTYMLVPQGGDIFVNHKKFLEHLLKIENIKNDVTLIRFAFKDGKLDFQPKINLENYVYIDGKKWPVQYTFYVYGHGSPDGYITITKRKRQKLIMKRIMRSDDLLHYINLLSNAKLEFLPKVILTQCYGHLHMEGNFPNISVAAISSSECELNLMNNMWHRNISVILSTVESWVQKHFKTS